LLFQEWCTFELGVNAASYLTMDISVDVLDIVLDISVDVLDIVLDISAKSKIEALTGIIQRIRPLRDRSHEDKKTPQLHRPANHDLKSRSILARSQT